MQVAAGSHTTETSSKTRKVYEALFSVCKEADPNFSLLQEAKAEYAKLQ